MTVLSIQSRVSFGHVGNSAATLPLERLGRDVCALDTVRFSSNPRYAGWRGTVTDPAELRGLIEGLDALPDEAGGGLGFVRAVLTGYFGSAAQVAVAAEAVDRVRRRVPGAFYLFDPVIGDYPAGRYVQPGVAEAMVDELLPRADLVVPNHYELDHLTGARTTTRAEVIAALDRLASMGPEMAVATSVRVAETAPGSVEVIAVGQAGRFRIETPLVPAHFSGTGDMFSAVLLADLLAHRDLARAIRRAVAATYAVVEASRNMGGAELALVAAQDLIVTADPDGVAVHPL
ncbi:pyridoxal kinase [Tistrella bauzanensis]|jgi:pyridoxine kinase|uniref:pyridoxal kinase n=1 Tax=Tistrella arctica TaxID=3133430 RepID=A0ABU9YGE0_9PROT